MLCLSVAHGCVVSVCASDTFPTHLNAKVVPQFIVRMRIGPYRHVNMSRGPTARAMYVRACVRAACQTCIQAERPASKGTFMQNGHVQHARVVLP